MSPAQARKQYKTNPYTAQNSSTLSVSKAAKILKISASTLRRLEASGKITSERLSNGYRIFKLGDVLRLNDELQGEVELIENQQAQTQTRASQAKIEKTAPVARKTDQEQPNLHKKAGFFSFSLDIPKILLPLRHSFAMFAFIVLFLGSLTTIFVFAKGTQKVKSSFIAKEFKEAMERNLAMSDSIGQDVMEGEVLAEGDIVLNYDFYVNVPSTFKDDATFETNVSVNQNLNVGQDLTIDGVSSLLGGANTPTLTFTGVGTINGLLAIDTTSEGTLESTLDIDGDVTSTGMLNTVISSIKGTELGDMDADDGQIMMVDSGKWESVDTTEITELGEIDTGTWEADEVMPGYGGTGLTSYTAGDMLYASGSSTLSKLSIGTSNYVIASNGSIPVWTDPASLLGSSYWSLTGNAGIDPSLNFIGTTDSQPVIFRISSEEKARIATSGYVGIGTSSPSYTMDITGDLNFTGTLYQDGVAFTAISQWSDEGSYIYANNYQLLAITDTGRVGIGITSPSYTLDVSGDINATSLYLAGDQITALASEINYLDGTTVTAGGVIYGNGSYLDNTGAGSAQQVLTSQGSGAPSWSNIVALVTAGDDIDVTGTTTASIALESDIDVSAIRAAGVAGLTLYDDGSNIGVFVEDGGQVGVGTNSPTQTLDVTGAVRLGTAGNNNVLNTSSGAAPTGSLYWGNREICDSSGNCVGAGAGIGGSGTQNYLAKFTSTYNIGDSLMYDDGSGIGIGTTDPDGYALNIVGGLNTDTFYLATSQVTANATELNVLSGITSSTAELNILTGVTATASELNILGGATLNTTEINYLDGTTVVEGGLIFGNGTYMTQDANNLYWDDTSNRLGIGTTGPVAALDVQGAIRLGGDTSANNTLNISSGAGVPSGVLYWGTREVCDSSGNCAGTGAGIGGSGSAGYVPRFSGVYNIENSNIFDDGSFVGIGNTAPSYTLDVSGNLNTTNFYIGEVQVTSDAGELNILDGATANYSELNLLDGATAIEGGLVFGNGTYFTQDSDNLFWDDTANSLGIGTTGPSYTLDVNGDVRIAAGSDLYLEGEQVYTQMLGNRTYTEDNYVTDTETFTSSIDVLDIQVGALASGTLGLWRDVGAYIHPANYGVLAITDTGRLGIGTTSPGYELDVSGGINSTSWYLGSVQVTANAGEINVLDDMTANTTELNYLDGTTALNGGIIFGNGTYLAQDVATFFWDDSSNELAIGNTAPANALHVGVGDSGPPTYIAGHANSAFIEGDLEVRGVIYGSLEGEITQTGFETGGVFYADSGGTLTNDDSESFFWDPDNDRLGIGHSAPSFNIDVNGSLNATSWYISSNQITSTAAELNYLDETTVTEGGLVFGNGTYLAQDDEQLFWDASQNRLGIGTTGPGYELDVNGSLNTTSLYIGDAQVTSDATELNILDGATVLYSELNYLDGTTVLGGGITFGNDSYITQDRANLFWDDSSNELAIGNTAPWNALHIGTGDSGPPTYILGQEHSAYIEGDLEVYGTIYGTLIGEITTTGFEPGGVFYANSVGTLTNEDSEYFYWDLGNHRLGIGHSAPTQSLDIHGGLRLGTNTSEYNVLDTSAQGSAPSGLLYWGDRQLCDSSGNCVGSGVGIGGSGTAHYIPRFSASTSLEDSLMYDAGNGIGIGSTAVASLLHLAPSTAGALQIDPYGTGFGETGELRFLEMAAEGTNYTGFKAPDTLPNNVIYTLPDAAAASDYVLTWQNGNVMEWKEITGVGGAGDITAVGSVQTGNAFRDTSSGDGQWLGLGGSAGRVAFYDGVTDTVSLLDANVGIGTTEASYTLDVNGSLNTTSFYISGNQVTSTAAELNILNGATLDVNELNILDGATVSYSELNYLDGTTVTEGGVAFGNGSYITQDADNLYWDDTANRLGIGTTGPNYALEVDGDIGITTGNELYSFGSATLGNRTYTQDNYVTDAETFTSSVDALDIAIGDLASGTTGLWRDVGTYIHPADYGLMAITDTGRLGIGTTSPGYELDVSGSINTTSLYIGDSQVTSNATELNYLDGTTVNGGAIMFGNGSYITHDVSNLFWNDTSNRLGVGTTGPTQALDVHGAVRLGANTSSNNTLNTSTGSGAPSGVLYWGTREVCDSSGNCTGSGAGIGGQGSQNWVAKFSDTYDITDSMIYDDGSGVGIGTSAPGYLLDIGGVMRATTARLTNLIIGGTQVTSSADELNYLDGTAVTAGGLLYGNGSIISNMGAGTAGQIVISNGAGAPSWVNIISRLVAGDDIDITGTATATIAVEDDITASALRASSGSGLALYDDGSNLGVFVEDGGQVGINTNSPSYALDVDGDISTNSDLYIGNIALGSTGASSGATLVKAYDEFAYSSGENVQDIMDDLDQAIADIIIGSTGLWRDVGTYIHPSNYGLLAITDTGRVGIGTTSPSYLVDISGIINTTNLYLGGSQVTSNATEINYLDGTSVTEGGITFGNGSYITQDASNLYWDDSANRLGVGTTGPNHVIDINGNIGLVTGGYINWGATDGSSGYGFRSLGGIMQYRDSTGNWTNIGNASGLWNDMGNYISPSNYDNYSITDSGFLGVGTTLPAYTVDVVGDINFTGTLYEDGSPVVMGQWTDEGNYIYANNYYYAVVTDTGYLGVGSTSPQSALDVYGNAWLRGSDSTTGLFVDTSGRVGIGTTGPDALLDVNSNFVVQDGGNVGIGTTSPTYMLDIASSDTTGALQLTAGSVTTGTGFNISFNGLTTGTGLNLASTSASLTSGSLVNIDWSPDSAATATGDLFLINIGSDATVSGNIFRIADNGSDIFKVGESQIVSSVPHSFEGTGDVSIANDLVFTNQTSSNIQSYGPFTIEAGESFESNDLTLKTYNNGDIVFDAPGGATLVQEQHWTLNESSTVGLRMTDSSGNELFNIDTTNQRIGIGMTNPDALFDVNSLMVVQSGGNVGIGITSPVYTLDVNGDIKIASGSDLYIGTVGIGTTGATSGATLVGVFDEFGYSSSENVQDVLDDLDTEIGYLAGGQAGLWRDIGTYIAPINYGLFSLTDSGYFGIGTTNPASALDVYGNAWLRGSDSTTGLFVNTSGRVGIGTTGPDALFDVNSNFVVQDGGNVGIGTTSPTYMLDIVSSDTTGALQLTGDSITTGTGFNLSFNGLTTGTGLSLASTSASLTTGSLVNIDWSPDSSATATGDLFLINVGSNATVTGNIFRIADNGSDIFTVTQNQIESAAPHLFSSAGDVSMEYDLIFTNQNAATIESYGPLTIEAGESFESNTLTLKAYNSGSIVLDSPGGLDLTQEQIWTLNDSSTTALRLVNSSASDILSLDTTNARVGIGSTSPASTLDVTGNAWLHGASGQTGLYVNTLGRVGIGTTGPDALFDVNSNFVVQDGGNVGIGTTGPVRPLHIVATSGEGDGVLRIEEYNGGEYQEFSINGDGSLILSTDNGTQAMLIYDSTSGSDDGYVLIGSGDSHPSENLQVVEDQDDTTAIRIDNTNAGTDIYHTSLQFYDGSSGKATLKYNNLSDLFMLSADAAGSQLLFATAGTEQARIDASGNLGIGTTAPEAMLDINGNVVVQSGGWMGIGTTSPTSLLDIVSGGTTGLLELVGDSITTGTGIDISLNGLTTGTGLNLASTSASLTTGSLVNIDWSPGSSATATGDLFLINVGSDATVSGNIFRIADDGSDVFKVSQAQIESAVPHLFSADGDVSMAYDLYFTNQTASVIESYAPITIRAGEIYESSTLTLQTYNSGDIVFDSPGGVTLTQEQIWTLNDSSTTALRIVDVSANDILSVDSTNARVGIGSTSPASALDVTGNAWLHGASGQTGLYVNSSGNVGIGTTGPTSFELQITGDIGPNADDTYDLGSNTARWQDLYLGPSTLHIGTSTSDEGTIDYDTVGNVMRFESTGNIAMLNANLGIGTTSPTYMLDIVSSDTTGLLNLTGDSITTGTAINVSLDSLTSGTGLLIEAAPGTATTIPGTLLHINTGANATVTGALLSIQDNSSDVFKVTPSKITSAVPHEFTAAGDISLSYDLLFTNQSASYIKSNAPLYIEAGESFESNDLTLSTYNSGDLVFDVDSLIIDARSGNLFADGSKVSVGTTSPQVEFNVEGAAYSSGGIHIGSTAPASLIDDSTHGATSTTLYLGNETIDTSVSDRRMKENITPSKVNALELINSMDVVDFDWIEGSARREKGRMTGLIAQDVYKYLPQVIKTGASPEDFWSVEYHHIVPFLIKGMQEEYEFLSNLGTNVIDLQTDVGTVEDELAAVKDEVALINELLGFDTEESSESSESARSTTLAGITEMIEQMQGIFDEFKGFIEALGLSTVKDKSGNDVLTVENDMNVMGNATFNDITVTGDLMAGTIKVNSLESSIDILGPSCYSKLTEIKNDTLCNGQTLYFQKTLAGNVDFFNGAIVLKPDGTMTVDGTVRAEKYEVNTTKVAAASAGKITIPAGAVSLTVTTSSLTPDSLIFVTPEEPVTIGSRVTGDDTFEITLKNVMSTDLVINWWVVN